MCQITVWNASYICHKTVWNVSYIYHKTVKLDIWQNCIRFYKFVGVSVSLKLVGDRKGSISAFGRNFRFRLMPKHFGKISLSAERTFSAEMTHFCRNWGINGAGSNRNRGNFGRNNPLSAEIPSFGFFLLFRISYGWFLLSAEIAHSQTPSFGFGRNSFGRPLAEVHLSQSWHPDIAEPSPWQA